MTKPKPQPLNVATEPLDGADDILEERSSSDVHSPSRRAGKVDGPTTPIDEQESLPKLPEVSQGKEWRRWVLLLFPLAWLAYALGEALVKTWLSNPLIAVPLSTVSLLFFWVFGSWLLREYRAAREVGAVIEIKAITSEAQPDDSPRALIDALSPVIDRLEKQYPQEVAIYRSEMDERLTVETYKELVENVVLVKPDQRVDELIQNATLSAAGMVAISPHPVLDAMIVLYRATALVQSISAAYGRTSTGLSSLRLFRHIVMSALSAAAIEAVGTMGVESLGLGASEKALKGIGEGAVTALRMHRLGKITKRVLRPL